MLAPRSRPAARVRPYNCRMDPALKERFSGIDRLYGTGTVDRLSQCRVAVVGMGGVGSWVVEALARSAVGQLSLIDADDICVSNTNRQLPALDGQYGRNKALAMAERCRAINPAIDADAVQAFLTPSNLEELLGRGFDLVIDAIQRETSIKRWPREWKLALIEKGNPSWDDLADTML